MPTLKWIGKDKIINYHNEVPFCSLNERTGYSVNSNETENLLIKGDNLEALKALLPYYYNKIKAIYIDPPYNTGNEDWRYNDNVNSPEIKKWLGKVVGGEAEDLSRHDKWLCMMYPRLKLLQELLSEDGVCFVSIDDSEQHHLKLLMDEIFGEENFVAIVTVQSPSYVETTDLIKMNEFLVVYKKTNTFSLFGSIKTSESRGTVGNPDQTMPIIEFPAGLKVVDIEDGIYTNTRKLGGPEDIELISKKIVVENGRLKEPVKLKARWRNPGDMRKFFANNCKPIINKFKKKIVSIYFKGDRFMPHTVKESGEKFPSVIISDNIKGINSKGSQEINQIFGKPVFDYPKLKFLELGKPLFDKHKQIIGEPSYEDLAGYIYFTETHCTVDWRKANRDDWYVGENGGVRYFVIYGGKNELGEEFLEIVKLYPGKKVVYADAVMIDDDELERFDIMFKQIPYEIKTF